MHRMKFILASITLSLLAVVSSAWAEEGVVCAAILACDNNGGVLQQYKGGPCESYYQAQCTAELANGLSSRVESCENGREALLSSNGLLNKQNLRLKRQIRKLKRQRSL